MRIIVMADSHGAGSAVMRIVEKNIYTADMFIHLGDGADDTLGVLQEHPQIRLFQIRGNCDNRGDLPVSQIIETVTGPDEKTVRIFAVHGHLYSRATREEDIMRAAVENDCGIALFGHTHCRCDRNEDGIMLINPGSCAQPRDGMPPSYAYIDITEWGVITGIVDLTE